MDRFPAAQAQKLKDLLIRLSPLIEEYTSRVCPGCTNVCCRQKRSIPDSTDIRYIAALDQEFPEHDPARHPEGPCQFTSKAGCALPRWLRPWRCTWYFCDRLLAAMSTGPQKKVRALSALIQQVVDVRSSLS